MAPSHCQNQSERRREYSAIFQSSIHALDSILILNSILLDMLDSTQSIVSTHCWQVRLTQWYSTFNYISLAAIDSQQGSTLCSNRLHTPNGNQLPIAVNFGRDQLLVAIGT